MTPNNEKQAMMPEGAIVFPNDRGTAPGLAVEDAAKNKTVILLPGPPREMTAMFDLSVRPYLAARSCRALVSRSIHLFGIGESAVENRLRQYMEEHTNPTVAPYAKEGEVQLRVTAAAATAEEAEALCAPVVEELRAQLSEYVYGVDIGSLQNALVTELKARGLTVATAESCTGGLVSKRITEVSGSSAVFGCGVCTYANEMKTKLLGVPEDILAAHGAVSPETAIAMARGVRKLSGADIGVSTTGVAGPDGGTPEKPVGLVYVAVSSESAEKTLELRLSRGYGGDREYIRYLSSSNALYTALEITKGVEKDGSHR
jgi:nicotinamide-nucleotide amidase